MSPIFEKLTREECEAIREADGYDSGYETGKEEGKAEGISEGRVIEKREVAMKMKVIGVPIVKIVACTGLSEEEIARLETEE